MPTAERDDRRSDVDEEVEKEPIETGWVEDRLPMTTEPQPDLRASYRLLSLAARLVQRRQDDALAPLGLTRAAVIALDGIATGPRNQEQLAAIVDVKSQTLGKVLTRLQDRGLLTRTRHPSDRRQLIVELTGAGEAALAAARKAEIDAFPADMDPEDWRILQEELAKFVASLHAPQRGSETSPEPTRLVPGTGTP
ncbi:MarR family winged helix-turn-helix transcriptional regulator [Arthrobacter sp. ISL-72]|uniref:MarR family winged helix-turn-helix transcriptional regulator n=1 Tax=Arthrobacter sp. ISL-72 TaxID=2819114 RepID=UPI00203562FE|nr:MarR family transcriptional regulator [Arthrobacter sp. ISL-72]